MKVIKDSKPFKIKCNYCKAVLEVTESDLSKPTDFYSSWNATVVCPACGNTLWLEKSVWSDKYVVKS